MVGGMDFRYFLLLNFRYRLIRRWMMLVFLFVVIEGGLKVWV